MRRRILLSSQPTSMAVKSSWRTCTPTIGAPSTKSLWESTNSRRRPIQEQIRTVVSDDTFLRELDRTRFSDALLKARRKLFLNEAVYTRITNDPALTAVVEQITQQENSIRYKVGGRQLTRAELTDFWHTIRTGRLREQAWRATSQVTTANSERIQNAIKLRNQLARKYSAELFSTFMLHRKGMEVQKLFEWFEQIWERD